MTAGFRIDSLAHWFQKIPTYLLLTWNMVMSSVENKLNYHILQKFATKEYSQTGRIKNYQLWPFLCAIKSYLRPGIFLKQMLAKFGHAFRLKMSPSPV